MSKSKSKLKAVIFDIDGVLIDSVYANSVFFERIFKTHAPEAKYTRTEYIKRNHLTMWHIIKYFTKEKSDAKVSGLWELAKQFPYPHSFVKVPRDANQVVRRLSKKFRLAVVTARVRSAVRPVLKRYGYGRLFRVAVSFEDYKHAKPHPEPLLIALKKLRVRPMEAVYVGDMPSDAQCAARAGVTSINLSKTKNKNADFNVKSFRELLETINSHAR